MYNEAQAEKLVEKENPGSKAVDSFRYNNLILVRVEHPSPDEKHFDPFYSVDPDSGSVSEFSITGHGNPQAILLAWQKSQLNKGGV